MKWIVIGAARVPNLAKLFEMMRGAEGRDIPPFPVIMSQPGNNYRKGGGNDMYSPDIPPIRKDGWVSPSELNTVIQHHFFQVEKGVWSILRMYMYVPALKHCPSSLYLCSVLSSPLCFPSLLTLRWLYAYNMQLLQIWMVLDLWHCLE